LRTGEGSHIRIPRVLKSKKGLFALISFLVILGALVLVTSRQQLPSGVPGEEAENRARQIENRVGKDAFEKLGAVSFYFVPGGRANFYDLKRRYAEVEFASDSNQFVVQFDETGNHIVYKNRVRIDGPEADAAHEKAVKFHINDFFWLNPFMHMRSPGAKRMLTEAGDLMIHYESGGATPGDSYVIHTDSSGLPVLWRLWVHVLPLKGIRFTFEDWREIAPGVFISLMHKSFFKDVSMRDVRAFPVYPDRENKDRFSQLAEMKK